MVLVSRAIEPEAPSVTTAVKIRAAGESDAGRERRKNEDRFHVDPQRGIFFVIDGVGGHAAGDVAASIAHDVLRSRLERRTGTPEERVREAIALANREIFEEAQASHERAGMACVLTVVLLEDDVATVGHVGDTRLYEIRSTSLRQVTRDHSPVGVMEAEGRLTESEAMRHPRRNEVYRDVGSAPHQPEDPDFIETHTLVMAPDTAFLLCTDGLTDQVQTRPILQIVRSSGIDPEIAAARLIDAANDAGGKDNVTAVLVFGDRFPGRTSRAFPSESVPSPVAGGGSSEAGARIRRALASRPAIAAGALALGIAGTFFFMRWPLRETSPPANAEAARKLVVGSQGAPFSTIGAALAAARPGDVVEVGPGTYREEIGLKDGVALVSLHRREAILEPIGSTTEPPIAVSAVRVRGSRLAGFVIRPAAGASLSVGVHLRDADAELEDLEISGATRAAVDVSGSGEPVLRWCDLHDNPGAGIVVRDEARPLIAHNYMLRNGRPLGRPGVEIQGAARPSLIGNVIADNGAEAIWMPAPGDPSVLEHNVFVTGQERGRAPQRNARGGAGPSAVRLTRPEDPAPGRDLPPRATPSKGNPPLGRMERR